MTKRKWNSGPPPHVGWWNASVCRSNDAWRWWDGEHWSCVVFKGASPYSAGRKAGKWRGNRNAHIEWTTHYPKNARVPRVKP